MPQGMGVQVPPRAPFSAPRDGRKNEFYALFRFPSPDTLKALLTNTPMHIYKKSGFFIKNSNFACSPSTNFLGFHSPVKAPHMRRLIPLLFILTMAVPAFVTAQSVTTIPVGFATITVPAATSATQPASTVISTPFYDVAEFQGALSSIDSGNQVSVSGASFGDLTTIKHLARFKSGSSVGRFFVVTANTATQLTLDTRGYTLTTGAPANSSQLQAVSGDSI